MTVSLNLADFRDSFLLETFTAGNVYQFAAVFSPSLLIEECAA